MNFGVQSLLEVGDKVRYRDDPPADSGTGEVKSVGLLPHRCSVEARCEKYEVVYTVSFPTDDGEPDEYTATQLVKVG